MSGIPLVVTGKNIPGLSTLVSKNNKIISYSGLLFDIWNEIARSNNFTFEVVLGDKEIVGSPIVNTSNWSGMIGMLLTNKADIIVAPVSVTAQRASVIEFTIPLYEDATCILTSATKNDGVNKFLTLFQPFDLQVWLCIIGITIVYSIALFLSHHLLTKKNKKFLQYAKLTDYEHNSEGGGSKNATSIWMYVLYMFGKVLMQDLTIQNLIYMNNERLLTFIWWVFAILVNSLYTSVLVSLLIVTVYNPILQNIDSLADLKTYSLCLQAGGYQIEYFNKASNPLYKIIYKYIQANQNNMQYLSLASNIFEQSYYGNCFGFVDSMVGKLLLSSVNSKNISCVDYFAPAAIAFAYRKNWIYAKNITDTLTKLHENGIISLIISNYLNTLSSTDLTEVNNNVVIQLDNLFSVFLLHACLIFTAFLVQILEVAHKKKILLRLIKNVKAFNELKARDKNS